MAQRTLALVGVTLAMILARPALATEPDDLIHRGVELRKARKDAEALDAFKRAYSLEPSPRALAQQGL